MWVKKLSFLSLWFVTVQLGNICCLINSSDMVTFRGNIHSIFDKVCFEKSKKLYSKKLKFIITFTWSNLLLIISFTFFGNLLSYHNIEVALTKKFLKKTLHSFILFSLILEVVHLWRYTYLLVTLFCTKTSVMNGP